MKDSMSNFDINAVITELTNRISKSELKNVFELNDLFFFRFRTKTEGTKDLVIELGKRIHLTKFKREFPSSPSGLCKAFRIHLKGKWLKSINQFDFDRICVLEFEADNKTYTLAIELFGKGNIILISPENKVLVAKNYKKMRDRDIHPGLEFQFPPSTGKNFLEADLEWIKTTLKSGTEKDLISLISKTLNINKTFAEEICLRSGVDYKGTNITQLSDEIINNIILGLKNLRVDVSNTNLKPIKYIDSNTHEIIDITPFPLKFYENFQQNAEESFSDSLDEYFSTLESDKGVTVELTAEGKKIKHLEGIRKKQEDHLIRLRETIEKEREKGNLIYLNLNELEELITTITNARRRNISWAEIKTKLTAAKSQKMKGARLFTEVNEKNHLILVEINGIELSLDFLKSASENANDSFKEAKKAEAKIFGAESKVKELTIEIEEQEKGLKALSEKERILIEKRPREWYEKFHWFFSSDGFLVIAGKDQKSNNEIVKKYLDKSDLFLHAEIHGASAVVIKSEGKEIPQRTINEAAIFSVSYSSAWKNRLSAENTYWVKADQVSFSAPSGEYLSKGSFIIKGTKNILKNITLEISVAVIIEEKWAYTIFGPKTVIELKKPISKIVHLIPGDMTKNKAANRILTIFLEGLNEADKTKVKASILSELISILPGDCNIKSN